MKVMKPTLQDLKPSPPSIGNFIGYLFCSRTQAHIFHLQTKSFAAHNALGEYYSKIVELTDSLVETYQGKYGIVKGYNAYKCTYIETEDPQQYIAYFKALHDFIDNNREKIFKDSDLLNEVDNIKSLLKSTIYKLTNLS